jgi:cytochrome b561
LQLHAGYWIPAPHSLFFSCRLQGDAGVTHSPSVLYWKTGAASERSRGVSPRGCVSSVKSEGMMSNAIIIPAYTVTARVLHWITALLVLTMIPLGVVIANEWGGPAQNALYDLHRSIGVTIIPLVILRILYRWTYPPLPLPADIPAMQRLTAYANHWGLYALLIVQPFTGWIATSAYRAPIVVFGLFELPPIWPENRAFSEQLFYIHTLLGLAIACLVAVHIGAALHHHFVRRDRVLLRMITG